VTPATGSAEGSATEASPGLGNLLDELSWRGMLHDTTPGLPARLASGRPIAGYNGFDPSGPSLHVGHLVPIFGLLQFQRHGGRPVALLGGGTGMIGDPSGTSAERNLLDRETLDANAVTIRTQLERFLDFDASAGDRGALLVNNLDWLGQIGLIDWLRDVGKHFTIPYMLAKDSVQVRLDRGLSFTEFSYMLIQATDYEHLHRELGVDLQMGGADQWGNITAGLELIRRRAGIEAGAADRGAEEPAHALAYRLLLSPSGAKFGKTEGGTSVWLDAERTSPYAFYQYWLDRQDAEAPQLLRLFTMLPHDEILAIEAEQALHPEASRDRGAGSLAGRPSGGARRAARAGPRHHDPDPRCVDGAAGRGGCRRDVRRSRPGRSRPARAAVRQRRLVRVLGCGRDGRRRGRQRVERVVLVELSRSPGDRSGRAVHQWPTDRRLRPAGAGSHRRPVPRDPDREADEADRAPPELITAGGGRAGRRSPPMG